MINLAIAESGERNRPHPPDFIDIAVRKAIANLKIHARDTPNEIPMNIVREVVDNI